jgi:hypothetical protein
VSLLISFLSLAQIIGKSFLYLISADLFDNRISSELVPNKMPKAKPKKPKVNSTTSALASPIVPLARSKVLLQELPVTVTHN